MDRHPRPGRHALPGYCVNRPAQVHRRIGRGGPAESRTLRPRQFHLIPAHDASEWQRRGRSEMLAMHLSQDLIDDTAGRMWSASASRVALDVPLGTVDPLLEQLALAILEILREAPDPSSSLYVDELVHAMAVRLVRGYTANGRSSRVATEAAPPDRADLGRVRDVVEAHLAEDLSLEMIAGAIASRRAPCPGLPAPGHDGPPIRAVAPPGAGQGDAARDRPHHHVDRPRDRLLEPEPPRDRLPQADRADAEGVQAGRRVTARTHGEAGIGDRVSPDCPVPDRPSWSSPQHTA